MEETNTMCTNNEKSCDYEAGVTIKNVDKFIDALAIALPEIMERLQETLQKRQNLKKKLAAGVPVDVREIFAAKAKTTPATEQEPEPEEEPAPEPEPIPVEQEEWFKEFTSLSTPYGVLAAVRKYKEATGCTMCSYELESFIAAYLQKCAKTLAYWLTDMPSDIQKQREYLAAKCWERSK